MPKLHSWALWFLASYGLGSVKRVPLHVPIYALLAFRILSEEARYAPVGDVRRHFALYVDGDVAKLPGGDAWALIYLTAFSFFLSFLLTLARNRWPERCGCPVWAARARSTGAWTPRSRRRRQWGPESRSTFRRGLSRLSTPRLLCETLKLPVLDLVYFFVHMLSLTMPGWLVHTHM